MQRRTFLGGLLATAIACLMGTDSKNCKPKEESSVAEECFYEFGSLNGMSYQYIKSGHRELTMYVLADGSTGLAQASPQAVLFLLGKGDVSWQTSLP